MLLARSGSLADAMLFSGHKFCFCYTSHVNRLKKLLSESGGEVQDDFALSPETKYAVVDPAMESKLIFEKLSEKGLDLHKHSHVTFVRSRWIVSCIKEKKLVNVENFALDVPTPKRDTEEGARPSCSLFSQFSTQTNFATPSANLDLSLPPDEETEEEARTTDTLNKLRNNWRNFWDKGNTVPNDRPSRDSQSPERHVDQVPTNKLVVEQLKKLCETYKAGDYRNDSNGRFREKAAKHAITILSKPPYGVEDSDSAERQIASASEILSSKHGGSHPNGVGPQTADKVRQILESPQYELSRVTMLENDPMYKTLNAFTKVWGCGIELAKRWYTLGYRSIKDLRAAAAGNSLERCTAMISLGLKYYGDLLKPVAREQMENAHLCFRQATESFVQEEGLEVTLCGSYRRGKASTHDVDILCTSTSTDLRQVARRIIAALSASGFLMDHIDSVSEGKSKGKSDWGKVKSVMVMCIVKHSNEQIGRADLKLYHKSSRAFALLHCTGSAEFNRAMRFWPLSEAKELRESLEGLWSGPACRSYLSPKKKRTDTQKEVHQSFTDLRPNSFKLTDTELRPCYRVRSERTRRLTNNIIWEANPEDCVKCDTEEDVFKALGLSYVPPNLRKM